MTILGSSFPVTGQLTGYPALPAQAARYLIAAALLWALVPRTGGRGPNGPDLLRLAGLAATGLVAFNVCVVETLRHAQPAVLGTMVGGAPLVLSVLGPAFSGRRPSTRIVGSCAIVVAGIALVQGGGHTSAAGLWWAFGALAGEVFFSLLAAPLLTGLGPVRVSAWACSLAVPELVIAATVTGGWRGLRVPTVTEAAALAYLGVVLTVVAFVCWYGGLRRLGVERAGMFAGLLPVASLAGTALIDRVTPAPAALLGTLLVTAGLAAGLSNWRATPSRTVPQTRTMTQTQTQTMVPEECATPVDQAERSAARTRSA
ncbi:DMT family transporter [Rugosimonospora acidiphila]|uniref:DMT family transporter n=2 Tax=Rugosimonospora acidiphila TaxID=556531 RepID=A0ABP9RJG7_9ACTN